MAIRFFAKRKACLRDRALFDLAVVSKLRGCSLVKMKIGDLITGADIRTPALSIEQKTGWPLQFQIAADTRERLAAWQRRRGGTVDTYWSIGTCNNASAPLAY